MATEKAPVAVTGGAGFEFHDRVAARCLLDLLLGRAFAAHLGKVVKLKWEVRDSGQFGDDLVLSCQRDGVERDAGLSIKSDRRVRSNGFPAEFRDLAWEQWDGRAGARKIAGTENIIGLVVGDLAGGVEGAWNDLADQIRQSRSAPERILARLQPATDVEPGAQASELQRALVRSMVRPPGTAPDLEVIQLLGQTYLLHLDFLSPTSRREVDALADCRAALKPAAQDRAPTLWTWLCGFAGRKRAAGGTVDLPELLQELRGDFVLRGHPDFVADWDALERHSRESMAYISNEIDQLGAVERLNEAAQVRDSIGRAKVAVLVGASGAGKSGLAKELSGERGAIVVWLGPEDLDFDRPSQFESHMGLANPFDRVLSAAPGSCVVVLDAFEKLSARAQRLTEQLIAGCARVPRGHLALIVTAQPEAVGRIAAIFAASSYKIDAAALVAIDLPQQDQLDALTRTDPRLRSVSFNPGLRPILRNLKILDWVVRAIRAGAAMDETKVVNVSELIDWLWHARWIGGADDGDSRTALLMDLAVKESASLNAGVSRATLESSQQPTIKGLEQDGALSRRHERLFFQHDLLADWARLRALMAESPLSSGRWRELASNPRWHGALRLFAVWLLENERIDIWDKLEADCRNADDVAAGSLLLEAVLVASDPAGLVRRLWTLLMAGEGVRLVALLERFLYVGTVPDPRLREWGLTAQDLASVEHTHRVPRGHQWLPLLGELNTQAVAAARAAPRQIARVAGMFLEHTPTQIREGTPFPGRLAAAELAIAVVEELEGRRADGEFAWGQSSGPIFESLLRAAPDVPARVGELCLQLAQRRDWSDELKGRASAAKLAGEQRRQEQERGNPTLAATRAKLLSTAIPRGPLRAPWPDGPRRAVPESFRKACLDTPAFVPLAAALPEVALEVLLAVCIEEPQHDDPYNARHDDVGLAYWGESYPALFYKGPFLQFLRAAPEHGISFVVRLINFASKRQAQRPATMGLHRARPREGEESHVVVNVGGAEQKWFGEAQSFEWHYWSPCGMVVCALQALERWLYEQLDAKVDVSRWLRRLMTESASLALGAVLIDLGKRHVELLRDVLRPLLTVPLLYSLDANAAHGRQLKSPSGMTGWYGSAPQFFEVAQEWYSAEHRKRLLRDIAVELCLNHEDMREFFGALREAWRDSAKEMPADASLRLLAERLDPDNYSFYRDAEGRVVGQVQWPEDVQRAIAESQRALNARASLSGIPMRCRSILDGEAELPDDQRDALWAAITVAERLDGETGEDGGESFFTAMDAACAGIAVLLVKCPRWLTADPSRIAWCRTQLQLTIDNPSGIGSWAEDGLGDLNWPSFVAECGVVLLARDADDLLARRLVAHAATATQYVAASIAGKRAARSRDALGADFNRLVTLGFEWCALRYKARFRQMEAVPNAATDTSRQGLVARFVERQLPTEPPSLLELNKANRAELHLGRGGVSPSLEIALDVRALQATLGWLDLHAAANEREREAWRAILAQLLDLSLERVPATEGRTGGMQTSGPHEFDYWVLRTVASSLAGLGDGDRERGLWQRVVDLGTPGYQWVDAFFSAWVANGTRSDWTRSWFVEVWSAMIDSAVQSERWSSRWQPAYDLARMVIALLGFGGQRQVFVGPEGMKLWAALLPKMEKAQARWFGSAPVLQAFASFAVSTEHEAILVAGVSWVHAAAENPDFRWDGDLDSTVTEFLRSCWQRIRSSIQANAELTRMFQALLARVSANGQIAAATLRDQVLAGLN